MSGTASRTGLPSPTLLAACLAVALGGGFEQPAHSAQHGFVSALQSAAVGVADFSAATTLHSVITCADDGSPGSLRSVIASAGDNDTIDLTALTCSEITLATGQIEVAQDNLSIIGVGADTMSIGSMLDSDGKPTSRIFAHSGTGGLGLHGLTVKNGFYQNTTNVYSAAYSRGGCVYSNGQVDLDASRVSHCTVSTVLLSDYFSAIGEGGAVFARSGLTMTHSTITDAMAINEDPNPYASVSTVEGGAAFTLGDFHCDGSTISDSAATNKISPAQSKAGAIFVYGSIDLQACSIYGNSAAQGGAIEVFPLSANVGSVAIINSTISGNSSTTTAGGLYVLNFRGSLASLTIQNSTIAFNHGDPGGRAGIDATVAGTVQIESSILANNANVFDGDSSDLFLAPGSAHVSGSHNLIRVSNADLPEDTITDDPLLLPLANNGADSMTHALDASSPALDAGSNPEGLSFDQRGPDFQRVYGAAPDIGSFEAQPADKLFRDGFETTGP